MIKKSVTFLALGLICQIFGADVSGVWKGRITFKVPAGAEVEVDVTLILKTSGSGVSGTLTREWEGHHDSTDILGGKVRENGISFSVETGAEDIPRIVFTGVQQGDGMTLTLAGTNRYDGRDWDFGHGRLKRRN